MENSIKTVIVSAAVSASITLLSKLFDYFTERKKITYTEKSKIVSDLIKQKYEGIEKIRIILKKLAVFEDLGLTEPDEMKIKDFQNKKILIPGIFYSHESLGDFTYELDQCLGKYGHCIEPKVTVFLIILRNLLMDYLILCKKLAISDDLIRWSSIAFYEEVREFEKIIERYLIQTMNQTNSRYYARSGFFYDYYWKKYQKYFKGTNLYKTIYSENSVLRVIVNNRDELDGILSAADENDREKVIEKYYEDNLANIPIDLKRR